MKALAKRIPFKMVMHRNYGVEHHTDLLNDKLRIACLSVTYYSCGTPIKTENSFGLTWGDFKRYKTLAGLLRAHPKLARRAAQLYPSPPQ